MRWSLFRTRSCGRGGGTIGGVVIIIAFLVLVSGAFVGLVVQLGMVRLIGAESFGQYAYVISWTTVLGYVSTLGFHVSLLRLLPAYQVHEDWAKAGGALRFALASPVRLAALQEVIRDYTQLYKENPTDAETCFTLGLAYLYRQHLTEDAGALAQALERALSDAQRERMREAYRRAGPKAVAGFRQVLEAMMDPDLRRHYLALKEGG